MPEQLPEMASTQLGELTSEEQERVEALDSATDELYTLRNNIANTLRTYADIFPGRGIAGLRDAYKKYTEGTKIEELIAWNNVRPSGDQYRDYKQRKCTIATFKDAFETYARVKEKSGDWGGRHNELSAEENDIRDYYRERYKTKAGAIQKRAESLHALGVCEDALDDLRNDEEVANAVRIGAAQLIHKDIDTETEKLNKLLEESPDTYIAIKECELREIKRVFDERGTIVETPYVQRKIARVKEILSTGRPVFIHGELGTGKTEFAKHMSRRYLSQKEPLFIAGRKDIEAEDITATRGIQRKETPKPHEQVRAIVSAWSELLKEIDPDGKLDTAQKEQMRELHERAWLETFKAPIETVAMLGPLLQAMKEGRTVIIDEINAIPHHVLIVMNDLLLYKPGDMVSVSLPGIEPFCVKNGFCVLATGNYKPEDGKIYVGRQQIDAAFLSRFGIVSYDYLPMHSEAEPVGLTPKQQREFLEKNELYHMLVVRLLEPGLSALLPEGALKAIERLARVARSIQDIFSGREAGIEFQLGSAKVKPSAVLVENVLSIRHLIPIIARWKHDGFTRSLDDYLFLEYVSRSHISRPNEALFLYKFLAVQGDFFKGEDWPDITQDGNILAYPIEEKFHEIVSHKRVSARPSAVKYHMYSAREIVEALYGPPPSRKSVSIRTVKRIRGVISGEENKQEDLSEQLARERTISDIAETINALQGEDFEFFKNKKK